MPHMTPECGGVGTDMGTHVLAPAWTPPAAGLAGVTPASPAGGGGILPDAAALLPVWIHNRKNTT